MKWGTISAAATIALLASSLGFNAYAADLQTHNLESMSADELADAAGKASSLNSSKSNVYQAMTEGNESPASLSVDDSSTSTGGFSTTGNNNATTVSNVLKTKHDTVKNSINNVRAAVTPVVNNGGDGSSTAVTTNIDEAPSAESGVNTTRSNIKSSAMAVGGTAGDNSPVEITVSNSSSEQTGNLDLSVGQVEALSVSSLSATISGNSGGASDPIPGVDTCQRGCFSGDISGTFGSQGGITNVQQNTGAGSVLQGSVSLAMKPPALN